MKLILSENQAARIQQHGEKTYPEECCGFLLGKIAGRQFYIHDILPAANQHRESRQNRYKISPQDYLRAEKRANHLGLQLVGFYHSHPDHPARPSQSDLKYAWPNLVYLIAEISRGQACNLNAFLFRSSRKQYDSLNLDIKEDQLRRVPPIAGGSIPDSQIELTHEEIRRYSRHLLLPGVAMNGQKKLKAASVLIIGIGGLGSPLALYLAAAGIGRLGLVDFDDVEASNLQRQVIYQTRHVGRPKLASAQKTIAEINANVEVDPYETAFTPENALDIARDYDILIDGTDNFPTRYLVNDVCVLLGKPNVYGSIYRFEGQASVFWAEKGPCYRCLYPEPPQPGMVPSCGEGGVLGILPGVIGLIQATEAVKLILGRGEPLIGRLLLYDALGMRFREIKLRKDPNCPICGRNPRIHHLIDYDEFCGVPGPQDKAVQVDATYQISATDLAHKLEKDAIFLLDVREPEEWEIGHIEGAVLIPLKQLPERMAEVDGRHEIVAYCRSGVRSAAALDLLHRAGYASARHLKGGILAWSDEVDPSIPKY